MKIGFIGLGLMGGAMVARLQDQGHDLTVLGNRDRTELEKAVARGAAEAADAKVLAEASDIVMLCMGTSDQVEARMEGVLQGLRQSRMCRIERAPEVCVPMMRLAVHMIQRYSSWPWDMR